jgi:hypothetical protein
MCSGIAGETMVVSGMLTPSWELNASQSCAARTTSACWVTIQ